MQRRPGGVLARCGCTGAAGRCGDVRERAVCWGESVLRAQCAARVRMLRTIANGVARDGGVVRRGVLAAAEASLDELLGVVPRPTRVVQHQRE